LAFKRPTKKKKKFFCFLLFEGTCTSFFKDKKYRRSHKTSVSDPYSFFPDPDPNPELESGDQYGSGSNPGIQGFNDQKLKKNYS
jgi:hypothetical protein